MLLSAMRNPDGREAQNLVPSSESLLPSSLRRRSLSPSSFPAAIPETDSSSTAGFDASTVYPAEQSDVATSSDLGVCDRVIHYGDIEEMEGKEQDRLVESNSKDHVDGAGNGAAQGGNSLFLHRALAPAHKRVKESPLSSDAIFKQSHAGLLNLCIVVLIAVNGRLIIENLMKYGLLIRTGFWFSSKSLRDWPLVMCCLTLPIFPLGAFLIEKLAWHKFVSEPLVIFLHVMLTTTAILYPIHIILRCDSAVLSGFTLMFFASIVWLKLVSYAHTNSHLRTPVKISDKEDVPSNFPGLEFEEGISFKQLMYFMVAPTLCYQQNYPRTTRIRKGWVFRQLIKLVICTVLMGFIIEQYINPIVKNSQHPLKGNFLYAIERVLKLSVPTLYVWLCMFYCFFHLWLNILAELLQFGDREFYKDWWNAKTVEEYWRMWNMPVHKWMIRHIYLPCRLNGLSKAVAILISFLVSAVLHELCIAVPCHIFKFWAFLGILFQIQENGKLFDAGAASSSQIPLVFLTKYFQNKFRNIMVGNAIFWFFFCILGQPMCVLLYYHDVMNRKVRNEWSNC